jgi:hypothetical protein
VKTAVRLNFEMPNPSYPEFMYVHVYDAQSRRRHVLKGFTCWCHPQPDPRIDTLIIHNEEGITTHAPDTNRQGPAQRH